MLIKTRLIRSKKEETLRGVICYFVHDCIWSQKKLFDIEFLLVFIVNEVIIFLFFIHILVPCNNISQHRTVFSHLDILMELLNVIFALF